MKRRKKKIDLKEGEVGGGDEIENVEPTSCCASQDARMSQIVCISSLSLSLDHLINEYIYLFF